MEQNLTDAPVALTIFIITIAVSFVAFSRPNLLGRLMLHPYSVARNQQTYTVITSGFIHKDFTHLLFNMMSYYFFAFALEATIGSLQFGVLYFIALIVSDIPSVIKHKDNYGYYSLGASGAISAVVFAAIMHDPTAIFNIMFIPIRIWAFVYGILYLIYCTYASKRSHDAINHDAHLYGALTGIVMAIVFDHTVVGSFIEQVTGAVNGLFHH